MSIEKVCRKIYPKMQFSDSTIRFVTNCVQQCACSFARDWISTELKITLKTKVMGIQIVNYVNASAINDAVVL